MSKEGVLYWCIRGWKDERGNYTLNWGERVLSECWVAIKGRARHTFFLGVCGLRRIKKKVKKWVREAKGAQGKGR